MAQIIKNRRGSLDKLASATGSLQKGEILIATGSSKLTGVTNGQGLVFAAVESGSVVAANRVLQGAIAPIFSASAYGHLMDGVPFYASSSNSLVLLNADGNVTPDLSGNIADFSSSVSSSFASLSQSVASVTGDFSASVATSFSASAYDITELSASTYKAVFAFGGLSASVANSFSASSHYVNDLSASIATTDSASKASQTTLSASIYQTDATQSAAIADNSSSFATSISASNYSINSLSASVASVTGDFSSSVATSFSASAASQTSLSSSVATSFSASAATITNLSSSIATTDSASAARITNLSSSVATNVSASTFARTALSGAVATTISDLSSSIATTDSASKADLQNQIDSLSGITGSYATTGSNTFTGDQNLGANALTLDGGNVETTYDGIQLYSDNFAQLNANGSSYVWVDNGGVNFEANGNNATFDTDGNLVLPAFTLPNVIGGTDQVLSNDGGGNLSWVDLVDSASVATQFSASAYDITTLSSSVASVTGDFSSSVATSFSASAASQTALSASIATTDNAQSNRLTTIETTYATTGSNTYVGTQIISGSLYVTNDMIVYGSSSFLNVTASAVSIGTNVVVLNTANPGVRFGGISVIDSGSSHATGSLFWDSQKNGWIYQKQSGSSYHSAMLINGPRNSGSLGDEQGLTAGYVPVSQGDDHIMDSIISASATTVTVLGNFETTGNISASTISGIGNVSSFSSSIATQFSASTYDVSSLSASVASVGGTFSASVATTISDLSSSIATTDSASKASQTSLSSSVATSFSASAASQTSLSASIATTDSASKASQTSLSSSVATSFSASAASQLELSSSIDTRFKNIESIDATYATTGSNTFDGNQNLGGNSLSLDGGYVQNTNGGIELYSTDFAQLNYDGTSYVWVDNNGVHLESVGGTVQLDNDGNLILPSYTLPNSSANDVNQALVTDDYGNLVWTNIADSASVASQFSSSTYQISELSSSVASVGGTFSQSVATDFSASAFTVSTLSASIASDLNTFSQSVDSRLVNVEFLDTTFATTGSNVFHGDQTLTGSFEMTGTANFNNAVAVNDSNMNLGNNSALNLTGGSSLYVADSGVISGSIVGIGNVSTYSTSVDSRLGTIETSIGGGGSLGTRVANLEALTGSYATTGSNTFDGNQTINNGELYVNTVSGNNNGSLNIYSNDFAQLEYDGTSYVWVDNNGVHLEAYGNTVRLDGDGNLILPSYTLPNSSASDVNQSLVTDNGGNLVWTNIADSASVASQFSASAASQTNLSSSIATTISASLATENGLSASVATSFSASAAAQTIYSSSVATAFSASAYNLTGLSSSIATTDSASAANVTNLSASVATSFSASAASVTNLSASVYTTDSASKASQTELSSSIATSISASNFTITINSASVSSISGAFATSVSASNYNITSLSASVASVAGTFSSSVAGRLNTIETTYATTGSNTFIGHQTITGDVVASGSVYIQYGQDLSVNHIVGNNGYIELGNTDTDLHIHAQADLYLVGSGSGVHVHDSVFSVAPIAGTNALIVSASKTSVLNEFSASNISGVGNIGVFSQSVNSRLVGLENFEASASTALQFTGSNLTVLGDLTVKGTTTSVNSTTVDLGTNIINLNGTEAAFGGIQVADPTSPNTTSGSLLWDTTTDRWIAGQVGSEVNILLAEGDNVVSGAAQIAIADLDGYSDFIDNLYTDINAASASAWGAFQSASSYSSSFATSTSASNAAITSLSASIATTDSASVYSVSQLSASIATTNSASAFVVNELSYSVDSRLDSIETSLGSGGSLGTRVAGLEALTGSYATTGSNTFNGAQTINDVSSSLQIVGNGFGQTYFQSTTGAIVFAAGYGGVEINGANPNLTVDGTAYINTELSASAITGIGNVTDYSSSVASRLHTLETTIDGGSF